MTISSSAVSAGPVSVAVRALQAIADGDRADFDPLYHPRAADRENRAQPPSSRVPGPAGVYATALWLRAAFAGLHYDIHHAVADGDLVAVNSKMIGRTSPLGRLHRRRGGRHGLPAHGQGLRDDPIALVPRRRRPDHRALGQPRRPRDGQATRLDPANPGLPVQDGAGQAARQALVTFATASTTHRPGSASAAPVTRQAADPLPVPTPQPGNAPAL
jgi:hypothetical protein